jgi:cytochrome c oxidase assembly factor CtaG
VATINMLRSRWLALAGAITAGAAAFFPALLVLALRGSMTAYVIQVVVLMGAVAPLLGLFMRSSNRFRIHPMVALVFYNLAFFFWFSPPVHHAVTSSIALYALSLATLLVVSLALWRPLLRPFTEAPAPMIRLGYILLATIPQTFAGITMAVARPQYAVAGSLLALASKIGLFVAFAFIFAQVLRDADEDDDDRGDTSDVDPSPELPRWVLEMARGVTVEEPAPLSAGGDKKRLAGGETARRRQVVHTDQLVDAGPNVVAGGVSGGDAP